MKSLPILLLLASPAVAQPQLALPLDCALGETCFIEDYVDNDPAPRRQRDFACGINSRDGHKGTDFALLAFDAITKGVTVRAAAPGKVLRIRDDMPDDRLMRGVTSQNACGNAVLLDHGEGWQTLYCHLRQGSVSVMPGTRVDTGDALGLVGLSGQTNHPHLHIGVLKDGRTVDPFRPSQDPLTCDSTPPATETLWQDPPTYHKTGLVTAGMADHVPSLDTVRNGSARLETTGPTQPLVIYAHAGHAEHGDLLTLTIDGPEGRIFDHQIALKAPKVSTMRAAGRKAPAEGWSKGDYTGEATITRQGQVIAHRFAHVTVE